MGYYAKINELNNVVDIMVIDDQLNVDWIVENFGGNWIETKLDGSIRKQYCFVGGTYDPDADVFIAPQPFPSWSLDSNNDWQAPVPRPGENYWWNEETLSWVEIVEGV
jgi:hypothetical protein